MYLVSKQAKLILLFLKYFINDEDIKNKLNNLSAMLFTFDITNQLYERINAILRGDSLDSLESIINSLKKLYPVDIDIIPTKELFEIEILNLLKENMIYEINTVGKENYSFSELITKLKQIIDKYNIRSNQAANYLTTINKIRLYRPEQFYTNIYTIDHKLPFFKGEYIIIGARPGHGKTAMALNILAYSHFAQDSEMEEFGVSIQKPITLFISLELPSFQIKQRLISIVKSLYSKMGINFSEESLRSDIERVLSDNFYIYAMDLNKSFERNFVKIYENILMSDIEYNLLIIDYIQLLDIPDAKKQRHEILKEISAMLTELRNKRNVTIIALSQISRETDKRKEFYLSDLKESSALEADADKVLFLKVKRNEIEENSDINNLIINCLKNRKGEQGKLLTMFMESNGFIYDTEMMNKWVSKKLNF